MPFSVRKILNWHKKHGRKDLPWQKNVTPYRVWVSEIMLQQTQVVTVISYFERFMTRFPTIRSLAAAPQDDVLHLWTGLGYYARARNLHRSAKTIVNNYNGVFPNEIKQLEELPGIGKSTAGAVLSLGMNKRAVILDGNVKRVLIRTHAIRSDPAESKTLKKLWQLAGDYTPRTQFAVYNQAMMDLGAMICIRSNPLCSDCPLQKHCDAKLKNLTAALPKKKQKKTLPVRKAHLLIFQNDDGKVLLEKRNSIGIWGGLWSFPQCGLKEDWRAIAAEYGLLIINHKTLSAFRHTFSHFHLDITPVLIKVRKSLRCAENERLYWQNPKEPCRKGLPQPVKRLLFRL